MRQNCIIPFEIIGIDGLGQGVSKLGDKVTFIAKTTVGDKGEAEILAERKGVAFAKMVRLTHPSPLRRRPECIHYDTCPSCHYQHMDYDHELKFKKESFEKLFRKMHLPEVETIPAIRRFNYRNRIQLHYSLKSKLLGMKDPQTHALTEIPSCLIGLTPVTMELKRLYENKTWINEAPSSVSQGHVEVYWADNKIKTTWNRPYADGGFTQVFEEMNNQLKSLVHNELALERSDILDLFAGNGNLTNSLPYSKRLCVDIYEKSYREDFFSQNLYDKSALKNVQSELKMRSINVDHLLLDPPRSGLKNITDWIDLLKPETIAYVSCDPNTLARDILSLQGGYKIRKAFLVDFFPSTFHYESFLILDRNR